LLSSLEESYVFIVKERETNSKHQQIVSGVSVYAYWLSNLLIDVAQVLDPMHLLRISILIFGVDAFTDHDRYSMVWALVILYGPAIMAFTYATSFLFKSAESAQIATFVFNFLAGFILMLVELRPQSS
jgi:ATP-binding cassette subfamily A (ABC1) protein 3